MSLPGPLVGHHAAVAALLDASRSGRMHHAWLLTGPQGIGKARFARAAALRLLADAAGPPVSGDTLAVPEAHRIATLFAAGSHPDHRELVRLANDRGDLARSVRVDQVRALGPFFGTMPSLSERRVVVVDAIDDLERSAANALLKNLEEPSAGIVFLLVSHAPGRLLPTIRSRCRLLRFAPLSEDETALVLQRELPDEDEAGRAALLRIAAGAPGAAMRFAGLDVAGIDTAIHRLSHEGDTGNGLRTALARTLGTKPAQARYEAFLERAPAHIAAVARTRPAGDLAETVALWQQARDIADRAVRHSDDPQATVFQIAGLLARLAPEGGSAKA